jgi:hypothetical protein
MERHSIDEEASFEMLRERSRADNRKLVDLAVAVVDAHRLLPKGPLHPQPSPAGAAGTELAADVGQA